MGRQRGLQVAGSVGRATSLYAQGAWRDLKMIDGLLGRVRLIRGRVRPYLLKEEILADGPTEVLSFPVVQESYLTNQGLLLLWSYGVPTLIPMLLLLYYK
jgi:hypothetical protein